MSILDWIYPPKCVACNMIIPIYDKFHKKLWLCAHCIALFEPISTSTCKICGVPIDDEEKNCSSCTIKKHNFARNYACFVYEDLVRDLLLSLKFKNKKNVAYGLGYVWANFIKSEEYLKECMKCIKEEKDEKKEKDEIILVPVPMHPKKQRERGFNQAEILAKILSQELNIPFCNVLTRTIDTPPMAGLHPTLRAENLHGAFSMVSKISVVGKKIMLVDDIYTTGASLNECALTLKNAGANTISCMTLTITVKNKEATTSLPEGSEAGVSPA